MARTFPQDNRATNLSYDYFLFRRRVAMRLFGTYNWAELDDVQREEIKEIIDEGILQYYFPPPLVPPYAIAIGMVHEWSFMRPVYKFSTASGQRTYPLPDNFERPIGHIHYQEGEDAYYDSIPFTNFDRTMRLENRQETNGPPRYASLNSDESTGITDQEQVLVLHPTPDSTYKLQFQYQALARRLTEDQPYPLGGQTHGPGILASCLAVAERRSLGSPGPEHLKFMEMLAGNITRDTHRGAHVLGYNGNDRGWGAYGRGELRAIGGVFYENVDYGGYMD